MPSLPAALYRPMAGAGARGMLQIAFNVTPEDPQFDTLREEFFRNYEQRMTQNTYAFEGVAELLQSIVSLGLPWGVVTNKSKRFTNPLTAAMPLFATAGTMVSGDTTAHAKPHPAPLLEAARQLGIAPEACVYVGDDERDIVAGKAAGMRTVAATYGYLGKQTDVAAWNADQTINSPLALLQLLAKA